MNDTRWREIDALFADALELDTARRDALLIQRCGDDKELRQAVNRLLALEVEASTFLAEPVAAPSAGAGREPSGVLDDLHVGPYRLLRPLGHGGMGSVYRARREDDYQKTVAIKVVRRSLLRSDEVRRRFHKERQVLAQLEHPNVARLYDGGTTPDGLPYLVMERVEGLPIDRYCDEHRLTIRQRVELFRQVCATVGHAHRRQLVHCDLKPSNVLVTAEGTAKLLDFGIAELLRSGSSDDELFATGRGLRPVTPGYASPEQVSGTTITAASDVYSLGVLLYKLLCGHLPFGASVHPIGAEPMSLDQVPEKPSRRVFAPCVKDGDEIGPECLGRRRGTSPRRLARQIRGDLDAIVLKALRRDPAGRYATVDELARDIVRHLEVRPVEARRAFRSYRASRLLLRLVLPPDTARRRERLFWLTALALVFVVSRSFALPNDPSDAKRR